VADMTKWVQALRSEAPHLFLTPTITDHQAQERERILAHLSPEERLARADRTPVERRPQRVELTPEQLRELSSLPAMQRLAAYRTLQQDAQARKD